MGESDSDSSSTSDIENEMATEPNIELPNTITTNNTNDTWTTNEIDFFNFTYDKQPGLLVPIPENGKPIDFFSCCLMRIFLNL